VERSDFHKSSIFNFQSSMLYPGSGALEPAAGRDELDTEAAGVFPLLSDR
jgi:hypothetical protein